MDDEGSLGSMMACVESWRKHAIRRLTRSSKSRKPRRISRAGQSSTEDSSGLNHPLKIRQLNLGSACWLCCWCFLFSEPKRVVASRQRSVVGGYAYLWRTIPNDRFFLSVASGNGTWSLLPWCYDCSVINARRLSICVTLSFKGPRRCLGYRIPDSSPRCSRPNYFHVISTRRLWISFWEKSGIHYGMWGLFLQRLLEKKENASPVIATPRPFQQNLRARDRTAILITQSILSRPPE